MEKLLKRTLLSCTMAASLLTAMAQGDAIVTVVNRPDNTAQNRNYVNSRAPLVQQCLIKLPVGSIARQDG